MTKFKHLRAEILSQSFSPEWDTAVQEWELIEVFINYQTQTCLCTHKPIKEICVLSHRQHRGRVEIGNCCVNRFLGIPSGTIFDAIKRVMDDNTKPLNEAAVTFFAERGVVSTWEHSFYLNTFRKRSLTQKQADVRLRINHKVLRHLSARRVMT